MRAQEGKVGVRIRTRGLMLCLRCRYPLACEELLTGGAPEAFLCRPCRKCFASPSQAEAYVRERLDETGRRRRERARYARR